MAEDFILDSLSDMDPYDREERCRKTIRTLWKAIAVRLAACVLLVVAVIRANAAPIAFGLTGFALVLILPGILPLLWELKKQRKLANECRELQKQMEKQEHS